MDPGLDFAQTLLDQLRRDLKRFAPGRAAELARVLGRSSGFLREITPSSLKLHHAFAIMRFIGFTPAEYVARWMRVSVNIPQAFPGFFRRHGLAATDRLVLAHLTDFLDWGYEVSVDTSAPERLVDLPVRFESLGVDVEAEDVLRYADFLFSIYAKRRPKTLHPGSAAGLIRSFLLLIGSLPRDRGHWRAAANLLDLGFHFEQALDDVELRHRLFATGAQISDCLGYPRDGVWCARQASFLALLVPDFELAQRYRELMGSIAETHGLPDQERLRPQEASSSAGTLVRCWPVLTDDVLEAGSRDQQQVLATLLSDRDSAPITAKELDRRLGGQRAFAGVRRRSRAPRVDEGGPLENVGRYPWGDPFWRFGSGVCGRSLATAGGRSIPRLES